MSGTMYMMNQIIELQTYDQMDRE